jgi:seryl-tRNA synthetase
VLYAIRNGGFSGAIMPQNIVTGAQAQEVAAFVAKYAGEEATIPPACGGSGGTGAAAGSAAERPGALDLRLIRSEPDLVRAALARRGADGPLDETPPWTSAAARADRGGELRAEQNQASEAIAAAKRAGEDADAAIARMREMAGRVKALQAELDEVQRKLDERMALLPNLPAEDAPPDDTVIKAVGEGGRAGRDHLELAGPLIDMERGARVSGSRFAYLLGDLVFLELALVRFALDRLADEGFQPVVPPALVRERALFGTGFRPTPSSSSTRCPTTTCTSRHQRGAPGPFHIGEILDAETFRPLRRLLALLPARSRRAGKVYARHLPGAPVRQGRDVRVLRARGRARGARELLAIEKGS